MAAQHRTTARQKKPGTAPTPPPPPPPAPSPTPAAQAPVALPGLAHRRPGPQSLSGADVSGVQVHAGAAAPAIGALAYAQGTDIHLGPGQEQHVPHEGWHVVQQASGLNPGEALEVESDELARRARRGR